MGRSFAEVHPELICEWSERNTPVKGTDITFGSNKQYWWIGNCGHEWLASQKCRHAGKRCPYCAGMRVLEGFNDLASVRPEPVAEWSPENVPLLPTQVNAQSHRKVKLFCYIRPRLVRAKCPPPGIWRRKPSAGTTHGGNRHDPAATIMTEDAKTEEYTAGGPCGA